MWTIKYVSAISLIALLPFSALADTIVQTSQRIGLKKPKKWKIWTLISGKYWMPI